MIKKVYPSAKIMASAAIFTFAVACNQPAVEATEEQVKEETPVEEVQAAETEEPQKVVISEHQLNDIAMTSKAKSNSGGEAQEEASDDPTEARERTTLDRQAEADDKYEVTTHEELKTSLSEADYVAMNEITLTQSVIPLGDSHTIVSYNSNGKVKDTLHVVTNAAGEIDHIVFTHKHHKDEYDVENGMTGKEVKELRKDVKHMVKNGKVFLYEDNSNIMYVLEAKNAQGDEVVIKEKDQMAYEGNVDEMVVKAIVWKDKRTLDDMGIEQ